MLENNYIYHYTNKCALEKILSSKILILSYCKNYRDKHAESEALKEVIKNNWGNGDFKRILYQFMKGKMNKPCSEDEELFKNICNIRNNSYMACFSKINNNKHLWGKYAAKGAGVVLAFDKKYIKPPEVTCSRNGNRIAEARWINDMEYGEEQFVKRVISCNQEYMTLIFAIDSYKNKKYESEQETRLMVYDPDLLVENRSPLNIECINDPKILRKINYNKEAQRMELELTSKYGCYDKTFAIRKIHYNEEETMKEVKKLLAQYNTNDNIIVEKVKL